MRSITNCDLPTFSTKMGLQNIIIFSIVVQGLALKPEDSGVSEWNEAVAYLFRNTLGLYEKHPCILFDTGIVAREIKERIVLITDNISLPKQHLIFKTTMTLLKEYCLFVSTLNRKKSDIDTVCSVNGSASYMEVFETCDMCPLWKTSYHIFDRSRVRKDKTLNKAKHSHLKPKSIANYNTNAVNESDQNAESVSNKGTEKHSSINLTPETGNSSHIEAHNEEVEVHISSNDGNDSMNNRIFRRTLRTLFRVFVASAVDYDTLPERRFKVLNTNGKNMHVNLLTHAYSILTAMNNFLDTVNAYSAFVFSYIWIPIEVVYSFFESILDSVEEYVDYFFRIVLEYLGQCLTTVLGYPFQGLVIVCQYIFWAIGSVFNATISAFIQKIGEYILEWYLSMLELGSALMFLVYVLIIIATDVKLLLLIVVLKYLTALICHYLLNVIYFVLHGIVYLIVHLLKLVVIYILEWPLSMLGLGLQSALMFLVYVLIFIVTDVIQLLLFVVLKFLTALICYYLPNVIYFVLHGIVYLIVHFLKLVVIYPLVFIMFWVFENVYVMTLGMVLVTLAVYVGIFSLPFACLGFTYEKYQRILIARNQSR